MKAQIKSQAEFEAYGYVVNNKSQLNYLTLDGYKNTQPRTGESRGVTNHVSAITRYQAVHFLGKKHEISSVYRDDKTGQWRVQFSRTDYAGTYYFSAPVELTDVNVKDWFKRRTKKLPILGIELVEHKHGICRPNKITPVDLKKLKQEIKDLEKFLAKK